MDNGFFEVKGKSLQCTLCPNFCQLTENGQTGACLIRTRDNERIINPYSGILASEAIDPIEKKPLYHFYPASQIYSVGFFGCTLKCRFCQNYSISQVGPPFGQGKIRPADIVYFLREKNLTSIAFTYSEPTLYYEWVLETARLCRKSGIKTVLVTNGYLNPKPAQNLLAEIDAANIDLKSAGNRFYRRICNGQLEPVKKFIELAYSLEVHVEITTLVINGENDQLEENEQITQFIADLSPDIPLHISRYLPSYHFNSPATPEKTIKLWIEQARKKLHFVYGGNVHFDNNTYCKNCRQLLISRNYYQTEIVGLNEEGKCGQCQTDNYFSGVII